MNWNKVLTKLVCAYSWVFIAVNILLLLSGEYVMDGWNLVLFICIILLNIKLTQVVRRNKE